MQSGVGMSGEGKADKDSVHLKSQETRSCGPPARYIVTALCLTAIAWTIALKITISVTIVAMVKAQPENSDYQNQSANISNEDVCTARNSNVVSKAQGGEFEWDMKLQGYILSAHGYGFLLTHLVGGRLSEVFGPKIILGPGLVIGGLLTALCPLAARIHVGLLITARVLVGAATGVVTPAANLLVSNWFLPEDRSFNIGIIMIGYSVGKTVSMIFSGVLAQSGGWQLVFYFFGGVAIAFIVPWLFLIYNTPNEHPRISDIEKKYFLKATETPQKSKGHLKVPWLAILLSVPNWAGVIMGVGVAWTTQVLTIQLPTYLNQILHFDVQESGIISALPLISEILVSVGGGYLAKWLRIKGYLSRIASYHIFNSLYRATLAPQAASRMELANSHFQHWKDTKIWLYFFLFLKLPERDYYRKGILVNSLIHRLYGGFGTGIFFLLVTFMDCNSTGIVILLVVGNGFSGFFKGGSIANQMDLANNFTGSLSGIFLTAFSAVSIIVPTVTGYIIDGHQTLSQWKIVFYIAAAIPAACTLFYLFFGSAEEQPWNNIPEKTSTKQVERF